MTRIYSFLSPLIGFLIHLFVLGLLSFLFCWGTASYTLRRATDVLVGFGFLYGLLGLTTWVGRGLRFYIQTERFTGLMKVTANDRNDLPPRQRAWLLLVHENRMLFPWVLAGLFCVFVGLLFGTVLTARFSPDTVLRFLVRPDLPPLLRPDVLKH